MTYSRLALVSVLTLVWVLRMDVQARPPGPQAPAPSEEAPPVLVVPPGYTYSPQGRRDPFVNPIPKAVSAAPGAPVSRLPGLRGVSVSEAVIAGVVTSREPAMNLVVILAPGDKTYFAARNDYLFDAVIKDIQMDSVVFALTLPGRPGSPQIPPRELVRKVRTSGENQ